MSATNWMAEIWWMVCVTEANDGAAITKVSDDKD